MNISSFDLEAHLKKEHKRTPFSLYLREIVYGGNDGIITTFAVVAGFTGASKDPATSVIPAVTVLLFGLANLFADGISMSLGSFLSIRADQDVYKNEKAKEQHEIVHEPESEYAESIEILKRKGFSLKDATTIASLYRKNPSYWAEFMMRDELDMYNPENEHPLGVAIATFVSFAFFGIIPLVPYILHIPKLTFAYSVGATAIALLLLGTLRAIVSQNKPLRGIMETFLIGGLAAIVAYSIGSLFQL